MECITCTGSSLRVPAFRFARVVEGVPTPGTERFVRRCVHHGRRLSYGRWKLSSPRLGSLGGSEGISSSEPGLVLGWFRRQKINAALSCLRTIAHNFTHRVPGIFYARPYRTQEQRQRVDLLNLDALTMSTTSATLLMSRVFSHDASQYRICM